MIQRTIDLRLFDAIEEHHPHMDGYIRSASPDSKALEQVRCAKYAHAIEMLNEAMMRVLDLQERHIAAAYMEAPNNEINQLKQNLNIK